MLLSKEQFVSMSSMRRIRTFALVEKAPHGLSVQLPNYLGIICIVFYSASMVRGNGFITKTV